MATAMKEKPPEKGKPATGRDGGTLIPPPSAGSDAERAAVALAVGFPGAFGETCNRVEQLIRSRLLWEL